MPLQIRERAVMALAQAWSELTILQIALDKFKKTDDEELKKLDLTRQWAETESRKLEEAASQCRRKIVDISNALLLPKWVRKRLLTADIHDGLLDVALAVEHHLGQRCGLLFRWQRLSSRMLHSTMAMEALQDLDGPRLTSTGFETEAYSVLSDLNVSKELGQRLVVANAAGDVDEVKTCLEEIGRELEIFLDDKISTETPETVMTDKTTILFLAADPTDASRLRLSEELREIQEKLQLAKLREQFEIHQRMSVRPADISQALLDVQPKIVHFSGHGTVTGALCFENQVGETHPIQPDALAALFEQFTNQISCIVLNACYSEIQAGAISKHIDYVIGMNQAIGDKTAIAFTIGFYQALGAGRTIEEAYRLGCVQIRLQGIPEHLEPVFIKKGQVQP